MKRSLNILVFCSLVLTAFFAVLPAAVGDSEPNDTFETANKISQGAVTGTLQGTDMVDYYKFDMPGASRVVLEFALAEGDNTSFTLYDWNKNQVDSSGMLQKASAWTVSCLAGQLMATPYIKVERSPDIVLGFANYSFMLTITPQADAGQSGDAADDFQNPRNVSISPLISGAVGSFDADDCYFFDGDIGQIVNITLNVSTGGPGFMKIYDHSMALKGECPGTPAGQGARLQVTLEQSGDQYFEVYSGADHKGPPMNYSVAMESSMMTPDTTPPEIAIGYPAQNAVLDRAEVNVSGTASDDFVLARVELSINDGAPMVAVGLEQWYLEVVLSVGTNRIVATAVDAYENEKRAGANVTVSQGGDPNDTTPPSITIASPQDGAVLTLHAVELQGTSSDNKAVLRNEVSINGGPWDTAAGTTSWTYPMTLDAGKNLITARAVDESGNTASRSITLYVTLPPGNDTVSPAVMITAPVAGALLGTLSTTIRGTASDNAGILKVEVRINSGPWVEATPLDPGWSNWTCAGVFTDGPNTITARAHDTTGNNATAGMTFTARNASGDSTPPSITISSPVPPTKIAVLSAVVRGNASDNIGLAMVEVRINNGTWSRATGTDSWSFTATLVNGDNIIEARATDLAGLANTTASRVTVDTRLNDSVKPYITFTSPKNGATVDVDKIEAKGTASDDVALDRIVVKVNGVPANITPGAAWSCKITLKTGKNTIEATAYDVAGNSFSATITVTFTKKPKPPIPGFEAGLLAVSVLAGLVLLARRKRN